jgi:hypothetical protein
LRFYRLTRQALSPRIQVPVDWWQHVKARWAPAWFTRRWPVEVQTIPAAEQVTVARLLVEEQGDPQPCAEKFDATSYEFMRENGPCARNEIEIHGCVGEFRLGEGECLAAGSTIRVVAPHARLCWEARVQMTLGQVVYWRSEGAPERMER